MTVERIATLQAGDKRFLPILPKMGRARGPTLERIRQGKAEELYD